MKEKNESCVYTKTWIVKYMLDIAGYTSNKDLVNMKVIEPCCGEGSFVLEIIKRLCISAQNYCKSFDELSASLIAFDIDETALNKTKLEVKQILRDFSCEENIVNKLLTSWFDENDFIECNLQNVDLVIGNPPYIRANNISQAVKDRYLKLLKTFTKGTDIYIAFIEKGLEMLNNKGKLIYICSDRWQKNQFGTNLRELINCNYHILFNCIMHDTDVFEDKVIAYPAITMIGREDKETLQINCSSKFDNKDACKVIDIFNNKSRDVSSGNFTIINLNNKFENDQFKFPYLEQAGISLGIGIATGKDSVFVVSDPTLVESERLLPLAYAKDIKHYQFSKEISRWLVNPWANDGSLVNLQDYPLFENYMLKHKAELVARHISQKNPDNWYRTIDKVKINLLKKRKLLLRDINTGPEPILENGFMYPHHNLYWLTSESWDLEALGGLLLSNTVIEMMEEYSIKMRGGVIRNQAQYLRKLKIPLFEEIHYSDITVLKLAFKNRDRKMATNIAKKIYGGM